jgi:protein-S-isoprenylcysteine O-methyltransferase Ste14
MNMILLRLIADAALIAVLLFTSAGTVAWPRAWILLAVLLIVRVTSAAIIYRVNPALLRDRAKLPIHGDQPAADKILLMGVLGTGFIALPLIAGFDVFRWHAIAPPATVVSALGLILFVAGWTIKALALYANAFATSVVRLQSERKHALVDTGVYGVVRHPFYAGTPLVFVGMSLWLGSYAAALCAVVPIAFMMLRIRLEDRFLRRELPGYDEYIARVPHRLLPGIW